MCSGHSLKWAGLGGSSAENGAVARQRLLKIFTKPQRTELGHQSKNIDSPVVL